MQVVWLEAFLRLQLVVVRLLLTRSIVSLHASIEGVQ